MIKDRILDFISEKFDTSDKRRQEIVDYDKKRTRLIKIMTKTAKLSGLKLFFINQFMTVFGCGKIKTGPGTLASFVTVGVWFIATMSFANNGVSPLAEVSIWSSIIILFSIYAVIYTPIYTRNFNTYDHQSIVIDEVIGQLIALCLSYAVVRDYYQEESWVLPKIVMFAHMFLSFLLFRTLDISKPSIIGWVDRNLKNSFGVVLDDIIAGLVSAIFIIILFIFYENSIVQLHNF